jgi:hypothetical protein
VAELGDDRDQRAICVAAAASLEALDAFVTYDERQAGAERLAGLRTVAPGASHGSLGPQKWVSAPPDALARAGPRNASDATGQVQAKGTQTRPPPGSPARAV